MTEQYGGYAASSFEQVLSSCFREQGPLWLLQAEADVGDGSTTRRIESPEDVLRRMRQRVDLHCALLITEAGSPSARVRSRVKVGDEQVRVRLHHAREFGSRAA